jgi:hypothetical protein
MPVRARRVAVRRRACQTLTARSLDAAATEWRDILQEAAKSVLVLVVLERVFLTRHDSWLEEARRSAPQCMCTQCSRDTA